MKKILIALAILILVSATVLGWFYFKRSEIAQSRIQRFLEEISGTQVELQGVQVGRSGNKIFIQRILLNNPTKDIPVPLAEIANIQITARTLSDLRKSHLQKVSADLSMVYVLKDAQSNINLSKLRAVTLEALDRKVPTQGSFRLERFELGFGKVILNELEPGKEEPTITEVNFNGRTEVYDGITDPNVLIQAPVIKIVEGFNKGSLGLPRGKILENLSSKTGK